MGLTCSWLLPLSELSTHGGGVGRRGNILMDHDIFETHATENRCHFLLYLRGKGGGAVGTTVIFIIHRRQVSIEKKKGCVLATSLLCSSISKFNAVCHLYYCLANL